MMFAFARFLRSTAPVALGLAAGLMVASAIPVLRAAFAPPGIKLTTLSDGLVVSGVVTLAAAADAPGLAGIVFQVSGQNLGPEIRAGACTMPWDTTAVADGTYTVMAVGRDASGATVTSQPALVTVSNTVPDISNVRVAEVTPTSAVVRWSTTLTADSQVEYGPTQDYGFFSGYDGTLVTTHARPITGLSPATTYHYRVRSTNWRGIVNVSSDQTFTTAAGIGGAGGAPEQPREQPRPPEQGPGELRLSVTVAAAPSRVGYAITATVRREESPVADAAVHFQLFGPNGQLLASLSRTTDNHGVASTVYLRSDWQMSGVHRVEVSADQEGRRGTGTTTFSLQ